MTEVPEVESPCISVCILDPDSGYCQGCWRTRDEIAAWRLADRDMRLAILSRLRDRQAADGLRLRRVNKRRKT